jgi:hypothetical protein
VRRFPRAYSVCNYNTLLQAVVLWVKAMMVRRAALLQLGKQPRVQTIP